MVDRASALAGDGSLLTHVDCQKNLVEEESAR
jgi:hypothetical protein